jgi:hypothetical protein
MPLSSGSARLAGPRTAQGGEFRLDRSLGVSARDLRIRFGQLETPGDVEPPGLTAGRRADLRAR